MPRIKCLQSDFEVEEIPLYPPSGEGEHTFLWIEKCSVDTETVVRDLERELRLDRLSIGYAGRKDRWAVTRQWVSVPRIEPVAARTLAGQSWRVLDAVRHGHKLRTGDLSGNRFRVVVRDVTPASAVVAEERFGEIARRGLPNRFGRQRFGRDGDNAAAGAAILRGDRAGGGGGGGRRHRGDRRHTRFLVSALQSEVFNRVLERRPKPWELQDGDVAIVHRSGGLFLVADAAIEAARAESFEISPTGPIFGAKMRKPAGAVRELEDAVWRELAMPDWDELELPRGLRVDGARRALRVPVTGASLERMVDDGSDHTATGTGAAIELRFELPAGSYATVLVEDLFAGETIEEGAVSGDGGGEGDEPGERAQEAVGDK